MLRPRPMLPSGIAQRLLQRAELARLGRLPRHRPARTRLLGAPLELPDAASFLFMYDEIFRREIYRFDCERAAPAIIDAGANIGLSVLYFKRAYPAATVIAFEPDPVVFGFLERNIRTAGLEGVDLRRQAVWSRHETIRFFREGADAGRTRQLDSAPETAVEGMRLRDILDQRIDLLKMDIEGAELDVVADCAGHLGSVERLFVEYHSFEGERQRLGELVTMLQAEGFRLWMDSPVHIDNPFLARRGYLGIDLQLNIFGWRT